MPAGAPDTEVFEARMIWRRAGTIRRGMPGITPTKNVVDTKSPFPPRPLPQLLTAGQTAIGSVFRGRLDGFLRSMQGCRQRGARADQPCATMNCPLSGLAFGMGLHRAITAG